MEKGYSRMTRAVQSYLSDEKKEEISMFVDAINEDEFIALQSDNEIGIFEDVYRKFQDSISEDEKSSLKYYTGYTYKEINAIMRNKWSYDANGKLTDEKKQMYQAAGDKIEATLKKCPSLNMNVRTYRGVSLRQFYDYGITTLADLKNMEGKYLYDEGFTSTSLVRTQSLVGMDNFFFGKRNIEIEYLVPASCKDGAVLLGYESSYHNEECEYLINSSNLSKVTKVEIDEKNNKAFMQVVLIPKMIWDPPYLVEEQQMGVTM